MPGGSAASRAAHERHVQVWKDSKEWCELLWDGAFVYERHEAKAYSFAWNASSLETDEWSPQTHADNPNNRIFTNKDWPLPCPSQGGTVVRPAYRPCI